MMNTILASFLLLLRLHEAFFMVYLDFFSLLTWSRLILFPTIYPPSLLGTDN